MKFKRMKIRTRTAEEVGAVQQALYNLGYDWRSSVPDSNHIKFVDDCYGIETYPEDGCIVRFSKVHDDVDIEFANNKAEEHYLDPWLNEFVTAAYWTQPKTPEQKPSAPIGIRPRALVRQDRMAEIVLAMGRYVEAGVRIPSEYFEELMDLSDELETK